MGQILHRSATTTEAIRRAIQHSQESLRTLARRHGINPKTVAKWRKRSSTADHRTGPAVPKSTVLSIEQEAVIIAFRKHTLLPLDDCLYVLQATIPQLTRSSLHRCLERHGISRLPEVEGDKPRRKKFDIYPIGFFHIDLAKVRTAEGKLYLFVAIDRTSKFAVVELVERAICRRPLPSSKHSWEPFRIASTPCSPTTESSSPICRRIVEGLPQDGVDIPSTASVFVMASATV
jgi:transposase-like protein